MAEMLCSCVTLSVFYDVPAHAIKVCLLLKSVTEQVLRSSATAQRKHFHM